MTGNLTPSTSGDFTARRNRLHQADAWLSLIPTPLLEYVPDAEFQLALGNEWPGCPDTDVLQAIVVGYNQSEHSALPKPYTPADVLDTLDGDPTGIADKVREFQKAKAGSTRRNGRSGSRIT